MFVAGGEVYRALSPAGRADWEALAATAFFGRFQEQGAIVATEAAQGVTPPAGLLAAEPAAVLRHEAIPFLSYPYEWPFAMLQDAALLQLDLLLAALDEGMILKDSSPYNVQWHGARPVFIDVGSFEPLRAGEPWVGYRQFCMLFLYPLLVQAYAGVPFGPWLRGSVDGITPQQCSAVLSGRTRLRKGVLGHVTVHARMERRYSGSERDLKQELRSAGFKPELIRANVRGLRKLVSGLEWKPGQTAFADYGETNIYSEAETAAKQAFVGAAVEQERPHLVWDLGCNDGRYSRVAAAAGAGYVIAMDSEQELVERLYRALRAEGSASILPLAVNLADPSPGLGWRGRERRPLEDRGRPQLALCLALLHHLVITANLPLAEVVAWLRDLAAALVVEFVDREDPMAARLLARKGEDANPDYARDRFERLLGQSFAVQRSEQVTATRRLYYARPLA